MKWFISAGDLKYKVNSNTVANCESTKYSVCDFGKNFCRPNKISATNKNHVKDKELNKDHIMPVETVSTDH